MIEPNKNKTRMTSVVTLLCLPFQSDCDSDIKLSTIKVA